MKKIEKEYNHRFKNKELSGQGFEADALWNAIAENIESDPKGLVTKPTNTRWKKYLLSSLVSLFLLSMMFLFMDGNTEFKTNKSIAENHQTSPIEPIEISKNKAKSKSILSTQESTPLNQTITGENDKIPNQTKQNVSPRTSNNESNESSLLRFNGDDVDDQSKGKVKASRDQNAAFANAKKATEKRYSENGLYEDERKINQGSTTARATANGAVIVPNEINGSLQNQANHQTSTFNESKALISKKDAINGWAKTPNLEVFSISFDDRSMLDLELVMAPVEEDIKQPVQWRIDAIGGVSFPSITYTSASSDTITLKKNATEKGLTSTMVGAHISVLLKNKWLIGTGVEYASIQSKFSYDHRKRYQVLKENQLISFQTNANMDTTNQVYADTLINVNETRIVRHYNTNQRIDIPLFIGFETSTSNWNYGASVSGVFHMNLHQEGRSFQPNHEIGTYKGASSILSTIGYGARLSVYLGKTIYDKITLFVKPSIQWSQQSLNAGDLKLEIVQPSINIGLRYQL